ncbi:MAG: hypothetical protein BGO93_18850 [Mesorhizobium sp. 65-26]|jgi:type IV secretion system protein VirB6|uniref:type IV secretion system protein n=1 Tax=Mesorhizobium sp. 65-26 TaxID=1895781 RepID=UPI000961DDB2|nr:type IV secretion system protein [Mesorhizobium sp. 65-26]MBN9271507.1 type IV secretion system protein [Mesorhizobium sp.]OJX77645.1 MAG: hypothetical protein BGO93_18850 [Mesorhizobium sp. 65-26]
MDYLANFYSAAIEYFNRVNGDVVQKAWDVAKDNQGVFAGLFALTVSLYFLSVALGYSRGSIQDAGVTGLKIVLAYALIISWADFNEVAGKLIMEGPEEIGAAIAAKMGGVEAKGMANLVKEVVTKVYEWVSQVVKANESWVTPNFVGMLVTVIVVGVGLIPMLLILTFVILYGKFLVSVVLAIGPFAIIAYFFSATRFLFESWVKGLFMGALIIVFGYIMAGFAFGFVQVSIDSMTGGGNFSNDGVIPRAVAIALYLLMVAIFMLRVPEFAQSFAYGTAMHLRGLNGVEAASAAATGARGGVTAMRATGQAAWNQMDREAGRLSALSQELTARRRGRG